MSPDFTTHHDISMSGANKCRTRDGHNTGHFSRDHNAEIREDYPRYRPEKIVGKITTLINTNFVENVI